MNGKILIAGLAIVAAFVGGGHTMAQDSREDKTMIKAVVDELVSMHGDGERDRIQHGVEQVARFWREDDGSAGDLAQFCKQNYIADPVQRQQTADRYEAARESIGGHLREMRRELSWNLDIETGPLLPIDYMFARYSPYAHVAEDMFKTKIAFVALLNYPLYTLQERLELGSTWTRNEWAQMRLVEGYSARVPYEVSQKLTEAYVAADTYISKYNIYMHHLLTPDGERLFPEGLRLVTHWNLRDELKAQYSEPDGLTRQEIIYEVMLNIIRQTIPAVIINNPAVDWKLSSNKVTISPIIDGEFPAHWETEGSPGDKVDNGREPDTRYEHILALFHGQQELDEYYPTMPTLMDRRFERDREIPEAEVEQILKSVLSSNVVAGVGRLIEKRLGRKLRPFDIWYDGFKARGSIPEDELDRIVQEKYPNVESFQTDMPNILRKLGFDEPTITFLASKIEIDPSRGIGHAAAPGRRVDKARLRTRVGADGMDYKGYNIAIHEFGHNVEQVFSLCRSDHTLLRGVPNTAFTEGFAFVFQARDLELLGLTSDDPVIKHLKTLDVLWSTYEIGGVSLVDMKLWNWMYDHPDATAAELKDAVLSIARDVWNEFFASVFGVRDIELLAIYSHMVDATLYLPDYPLGHIIAFQVEKHFETGNLAEEMERMCKLGSITPDLWMRQAVGGPISTKPLLRATEEALAAIKQD